MCLTPIVWSNKEDYTYMYIHIDCGTIREVVAGASRQHTATWMSHSQTRHVIGTVSELNLTIISLTNPTNKQTTSNASYNALEVSNKEYHYLTHHGKRNVFSIASSVMFIHETKFISIPSHSMVTIKSTKDTNDHIKIKHVQYKLSTP